jgi:GT2 family glycosyltransferase
MPEVDVKPDASQLRLIVSIVHWRTPELVIETLRSIEDELDKVPNCDVYVVDNASGDGSPDLIAAAIDQNGWGSFATLIRSDRNAGFAAGNNVVIRKALEAEQPYDYVLLLNPDTIVRPDAFRLLMGCMEANPEIGIAGGRSEDPDATPQMCSFRFPTALSEFAYFLNLGIFSRLFRKGLSDPAPHDSQVQVDWVSGAYMMVRPKVFDDIGLMDEGYFLYYEETDFTLRARRAGWLCWHVPESRIVHLVGQSSGVSTRKSEVKRRPPFWFESRRRYFVMNHGVLYAAFVDTVALLGYGLRKLRGVLTRKPDSHPPHFAADLLRHGALSRGRSGLGDRDIGV